MAVKCPTRANLGESPGILFLPILVGTQVVNCGFIWFPVMSNQVTDPDFYLITGHVYFPNRSISSNLLAIFKLVNLGFFFFYICLFTLWEGEGTH